MLLTERVHNRIQEWVGPRTCLIVDGKRVASQDRTEISVGKQGTVGVKSLPSVPSPNKANSWKKVFKATKGVKLHLRPDSVPTSAPAYLWASSSNGYIPGGGHPWLPLKTSWSSGEQLLVPPHLHRPQSRSLTPVTLCVCTGHNWGPRNRLECSP